MSVRDYPRAFFEAYAIHVIANLAMGVDMENIFVGDRMQAPDGKIGFGVLIRGPGDIEFAVAIPPAAEEEDLLDLRDWPRFVTEVNALSKDDREQLYNSTRSSKKVVQIVAAMVAKGFLPPMPADKDSN